MSHGAVRYLALIALLSCARLPEYAAPKLLERRPGDHTDLIAYRTLTRADFKAEAPPPEFAAVADRIGAATCCSLRFEPGSEVLSRQTRSGDGDVHYDATVRNVRAQASMSRTCSWWNPKDFGQLSEYILEHEQIHFAICELEARRLRAELAEIERSLNVRAESPQAAAQEIQERLNEELREQTVALAERSREFDEDTSLGHEPELQKRWLARVQAELAATDGD